MSVIFAQARPSWVRLASSLPPDVYRDTLCGELNSSHINRTVRIAGFVQATRVIGACVFLLLRDAYGSVQVTITSATPDLLSLSKSLPKEATLIVDGLVTPRATGAVNVDMHTGAVEVAATGLRVISSSSRPLPLQMGEGTSVTSAGDEALRLTHRVLDLRRLYLTRNLRLRSALSSALRLYLSHSNPPFTEVDTPTLYRSTPEGAREFLVPTRHFKLAYALIQSPQQWKQMLMAGGVDRYFQFARCYRDEAGRADRQPEFTQIDLECAWVNAGQVMAIAEGLLVAATSTAAAMHVACDHAWGNVFRSPKGGCAPGWSPHVSPPLPLPRLSFAHAMATYGVDKPDRRLGMPIGDASTLAGAFRSPVAGGEVETFFKEIPPGEPRVHTTPHNDANLDQFDARRASVRVFKSPGLGAALSNKDLDSVVDEVSQALAPAHASQLVNVRAGVIMWARVGPGGAVKVSGGLKAFMTPDGISALVQACSATPGDMLFLSAGYGAAPCVAAGAARVIAAEASRLTGVPLQPHDTHVHMQSADILPAAANLKHRLARKPSMVQAPESSAAAHTLDAFWVTDFPLLEMNDGVLQSSHHPFTCPHADDADTVTAYVEGRADVAHLLRVRGQHYDLVINGSEIGGGSIRIHDAALQRCVLRDVLRVTPAQMDGFEPLLTALDHGAPPHGGIALGFDRLVALLAGHANARSVRDVIAFPKSAAGNDLMVQAPAAVSDEQLAEYGLQWLEKGGVTGSVRTASTPDDSN